MRQGTMTIRPSTSPFSKDSWRLRSHLADRRDDVLRERPPRPAVHLVTGLEGSDVRADRLDHTGEVGSRYGDARRAEAEPEDSHEVGLTRHEVPRTAVHPCGHDPHQDLPLARCRPLDVAELDHVRRSVPILRQGPHADLR